MTLFWIFTAIVLLFGFVVAFGAPYVPSLRKELKLAFTKLYPLTNHDVVVDLGSGDGQVLVEAERHGARGYGFELNPILVLISRLRLKKTADIRVANMWMVKLPSDTTLVYCFIVTRDSKKMERMIQVEADRLKRSINVMTFGAELKSYTPVAQLNAHTLYEIQPTSRSTS